MHSTGCNDSTKVDLGTGKLLMPNVQLERYSAMFEMVMASPNPIPPNATLLDNGASVNVMKTLQGAILSTYVPDEPGDGISVGDENAELESNGSYIYANRYTDRNGVQVVMLIRASYCPGVICNIISEPSYRCIELVRSLVSRTMRRIRAMLNHESTNWSNN